MTSKLKFIKIEKTQILNFSPNFINIYFVALSKYESYSHSTKL